ncbi:hypothetical protein GW17_00049381, partial [Ensete ventricosum]
VLELSMLYASVIMGEYNSIQQLIDYFCLDIMVRQAAMVVKCILLVYYKDRKGRNYRQQLVICVPFAKRRCTLLFYFVVNISSVKTAFERERTCPLCRAVVKPAGLRSFGDGSTSLYFQLF